MAAGPVPESLAAGHVRLRPFAAADAAIVERACGEPRVALATSAIPHPYPAGGGAAWIATHAGERASGAALTWAIVRGDGVLVGAITLRADPDPDGHLGWWIAPEHWAQGYATAAARAVIDAAFRCLPLDGIVATHLERNAASGRVMAKCGLAALRVERRPCRGVPETFVVRGLAREAWERGRGRG
jgi:RimJ/RimL family protein N-acetyltransferase